MQHVGLVLDDRRATVIWSLAVAALTVEPVERRLELSRQRQGHQIERRVVHPDGGDHPGFNGDQI